MSEKNLHRMMVFSFVYGGFLLLVYLLQVYSVAWRQSVFPSMPFLGGANAGGALNSTTTARQIIKIENFSGSIRRPPNLGLVPTLLSPFNVILFITGFAFIINGYFLLRYTTDRKVTRAKRDVYSTMLSGDEKSVFDSLQNAGGALTQKEISQQTGFSAVRTHRVINRLKSKGAVSVVPFGMTNKVLLDSSAAKK